MKNRNGVCGEEVALYSFNVNKTEKDQLISVTVSKLAKKDIEKFRSGGVKSRLI